MKIDLTKDDIEQIISSLEFRDFDFGSDNSDIIEKLQMALKDEN